MLFLGASALTAGYDISASSYLGGSGGADRVNGVVIQADGTIVLAANLDNATPLSPVTQVLGVGGNAAIVRLSADGRQVLSVSRIADAVYDLAADAAGNLYVAAGDFGLLKLNPQADAILWTQLVGSVVWRVDAGADGHCVALVPGSVHDNTPGAGTVHVFGAGGTLISSFGGSGNTLDVALDSRTQTVVTTGWYNFYTYTGPYSRGYNGGTTVPIDVPYTHGVPYTYGQAGVARKWTLHGWSSTVWSDQAARIQNPRWINGPFSTDPSNLYTQQEIDDMETAEAVADGYYQYLLDMPKSFNNNMADTRSYRVAIGGDGNLYIGYEADGGNTPLRSSGLDLAVSAPWTLSDGFFDVFYATSTVNKIVVSAYELRTASVAWLRSFGFTCRLSPKPDGTSDNTIILQGGALAADATGRVYLTGQSYYGQYLPGNDAASFSIPRSGETAFDPFAADDPKYLGGAYLMVYSPDFKTRLYSTRVAGGQGRALATRRLDTQESATFVWGGYTGPLPSSTVNKVHLVHPIQSTRLGADTGTDGWFAVVQGEPAAIRALAQAAPVSDPAALVTLDGTRSFSLDGHITSWTWTDLADGRILSRDETAVLDLPEGAYNVGLAVADSLGNSDATTVAFTVTSGDPELLPRFESTPPAAAVKDWPFSYLASVSTAGATTFTGMVGAPSGLNLTDNGDGTATLAGAPAEGGVFRVTLAAEANGHATSQTWLLTVYDGGVGGTLLDDSFTINSTSSWSFISASDAVGQPTMRWLAAGNQGYAATGVLNGRGYHQGTSSTQSVAFYQTFDYRENITDATLSTTGIHRRYATHPAVRALVGYDTGGGIQWAVSDQGIQTTSAGTAPIAPVPGSWAMNSFTWKSVDPANLNAGAAAAVPAATVLQNARAIGAAQLQVTGTWMADILVQIDSLKLVSHRDVLPAKPPAFTSLPLNGAAVGDLYSYAIGVADPAGLPVTVATEGALPAWLSLSETAGVRTLSGTPGPGDTGTQVIRLVATNTAGAQAWQSFQLEVVPAQAPVFAATPATSVAYGAAYAEPVRAHSVLGDPVLTLSLQGAPLWLGFEDLGNGAGRFSGTAPAITTSYPLILTASDGVRQTVHAFTLWVLPPGANEPPTAVIAASVTQGSAPLAVLFSGSASHDNDGAVTAHDWRFGEGSTFSGAEPSFEFTQPGRYTVQLTVTDDEGATGTASVDIVVRAPGVYGPTAVTDNFATNTLAQWNTRGVDALGRAVSFAWASTGQRGYDTTALAAPGVLRSVNPHSADNTTITEIVWKSFPEADLQGGAVRSDGIHSLKVPLQSGFVVEYDDNGTTRWAISATGVMTTTGSTAVAAAGEWSLDALTWRALDWAAPETGSGIPVQSSLVLGNATGFGVYNRISGAWLKDSGLQLASIALHTAPPQFPVVTSTPPAAAIPTGSEFSHLLGATDANGFAITWSAVDPLPAWLVLENLGDGMALLSGTPPAGTTGPLTIRLQAATAEAGPAWHTFTLEFTDSTPVDPHPPGFMPMVNRSGGNLHFEWYGHAGYDYQFEYSDNLQQWYPTGPVYPGADAILSHEEPLPASGPTFFRLSYSQ